MLRPKGGVSALDRRALAVTFASYQPQALSLLTLRTLQTPQTKSPQTQTQIMPQTPQTQTTTQTPQTSLLRNCCLSICSRWQTPHDVLYLFTRKVSQQGHFRAIWQLTYLPFVLLLIIALGWKPVYFLLLSRKHILKCAFLHPSY